MEDSSTYAPTAPESFPPELQEEVATVSEAGEDSDTPEEAAAPETDEEPEGEETDEDETPKTRRKPDAEERIQQLTAQKNELKQQLAAERERIDRLERHAQAETEIPEYIEITPQAMKALNDRLAELHNERSNAELAGDFFAVRQAQEQIDAIYEGYAENQKRHSEAQKRSQTAAEQKAKVDRLLADFDAKSELFRQSKNIPPDVWTEGGSWFSEQCKTDTVLGELFKEITENRGPMAAIMFAYDHYTKNGPHQAIQQQQKQKEAAKAKVPGGGSKTVTTSDDLTDDLPTEEWLRRYRKLQRT